MGAPASRLEDACHCGAVRVSIPADAVGVVACHCGDCQTLHGNDFAMLAVDHTRIAKEPEASSKALLSAGLFPCDLPQQLIRHLHPDSKPDGHALPPLIDA